MGEGRGEGGGRSGEGAAGRWFSAEAQHILEGHGESFGGQSVHSSPPAWLAPIRVHEIILNAPISQLHAKLSYFSAPPVGRRLVVNEDVLKIFRPAAPIHAKIANQEPASALAPAVSGVPAVVIARLVRVAGVVCLVWWV